MWESRKLTQWIQNFGRKSKSNSSKQNQSLYHGGRGEEAKKKLLDWKKSWTKASLDHAAALVVKRPSNLIYCLILDRTHPCLSLLQFTACTLCQKGERRIEFPTKYLSFPFSSVFIAFDWRILFYRKTLRIQKNVLGHYPLVCRAFSILFKFNFT